MVKKEENSADRKFMEIALDLATKGHTSPNPRVGCVIVKNGKIVGKGYHKRAGMKHAEIEALLDAGKDANGSTMYVTLEPCNHYGRTPPCTKAILKAGVKKVIAAMEDPNPLVSGKGLEELRKGGVVTECGLLEEEVVRLNKGYNKYMKTGLPFVTLKMAMSLDGKVATKTGDSKWISGKKSRKLVHEMRSNSDAVMVGVGTVLSDNPRLTSRIRDGKDPLRIVIDTLLKSPVDSNIFNDSNCLVVTSSLADDAKRKMFEKNGIDVLVIGASGGGIHLMDVMRVLGKRGIQSILIEGGPNIAGSAIDEGIVDELVLFIAPKLIGGESAPGPIHGLGSALVSDAVPINILGVERVGEDIMISASLTNTKNGNR